VVSVQPLPPGALGEGDAVQGQQFVDLAPLPEQVGMARAFVRAHAGALADDDVETLMLLTSELVTNVVIHARSDLRVGVTLTSAAVVVTVYDLDLGRREVPTSVPREGGRGLVLVEALASAWAVHHHRSGGKTVWFRLARSALDARSTLDGGSGAAKERA
jgi:anti-sigma regulatory factor (Ser/Thr protein kinase)